MGQKEELLKLMPNALNAQDYVAKGGDFDKAQLHVTSALGKVGDPEGWNATVVTLTKYGENALAYFYADDFGPGGFSLEVLFEPRDIGNDAVRMWSSYFEKPTKQRR